MKAQIRKNLCLVVLVLSSLLLHAQDNLMSLLEESEEPDTEYTIATFKSTRLMSGQSVEIPAAGVLQYVINHRFARITGGFYNIFGLDNATMRMGFDYGISKRLAVGVGRSSFEKTYDGYLKYKLLRQSKGAGNMPITVTGFAGMAIKTIAWPEPDRPNYFSSRLYYTFQLLIARKFNSDLSLQLMPTLVHRNLVATRADANDVFALGMGGRYKLTGSLSVNVEYYYLIPGQIVSPVYGEKVRNSLTLGVDIETGGHVFQLMLSNSRGMSEKVFITETTGSWLSTNIHFGFNINRVFTIIDKHNKK